MHLYFSLMMIILPIVEVHGCAELTNILQLQKLSGGGGEAPLANGGDSASPFDEAGGAN